MRPLLLLVFTISGLLAPSALSQKIGEVPQAIPSPEATRELCLEWRTSAERPFWYRLPKKRASAPPAALILMLHGTGTSHGWSFWNYGIAHGHFRPDDIVISPEGVTDGAGGTYNFVQNAKDEAQINELIDLFRSRFSIDRVYLYGHSQGGFFCYWYAGQQPGRVDGIIAHAGNVLQVKHSKLSREKVAVGILHARSDAVVPVDCAERSAAIYSDEGYRNLKLEIVENIRAEAGHWPLPVQVKAMFKWLDSVSVRSFEGALALAADALLSVPPDLARLARATAELERLAPKGLEGDDRARAEFLRRTLDAAVELAAASVLGDTKRLNRKDAGACARWRAAHALLAPSKAWQKRFRSEIRRAASDQKSVVAVIGPASGGSQRALDAAMKWVKRGSLAPSFDEWPEALGPVLVGAEGRSAEALRKGLTTLKGARDQARNAMRALADALGEAHREEGQKLFPAAGPQAPGDG